MVQDLVKVSMKKTILSLFSFLLVSFFLSQAWALEYQHARKNFSLTIPEKWEFVSDFKGTALIAFQPSEGDKDSFRENMNVYIHSLSSLGLTTGPEVLNQYVQRNTEKNKRQLYGFKVLGQKKITVQGQPAVQVEATHKMQGLNLKVLVVYFVKGELAYSVTGSALENRYDEFKPAFEKMASSFK